MQVKLFDEEHELDLEDAINAFLNRHPQQEEQIFCFSAMIVYENKRPLADHTNGVEVKDR